VDTQDRGHVDPADQWVFDPATGSYELRLQPDEPPAIALPAQDSRRERRLGAQRNGGGSHPAAMGRGGARASRRKPKPKKSAKKRALIWTAGSMGFGLVAVGVCGYLAYQHFNGNLTSVDTAGIGSSRTVPDGPMNILVIGTDSRKGLGRKYGDAGSVGHADTTILFHVSKDRSNVTALSIPRDIITNVPDCPTKQQDGSIKIIPGAAGVRFNTSLGQAGRDPGCTMRTVREVTGITPDHFMMVDFHAVKDLSTAVGGVSVCLGHAINDPKSHLELSAGTHTVKGEQALAFVRTRHSVGFGGDLDRIKLQQQFLGSMIRKMQSGGTVSDPGKLWDLANAATKALTVDTGIGSVKKLSELAKILSGVNARNITFTTVPVIDNPAEKVHATVVLDETRAPQLFSMIKQDVSLTAVNKQQQTTEANRLKGSMAAPVNVRVEIYNGSSIFGAAQETLSWLQNNMGVNRSTNGGNAGSQVVRTKLEYAPNQADQARRLAGMMGLPASSLQEGTKNAAWHANMKLTLGKDFTAPGTPIAAPATVPDGIQKVGASGEGVCAN
jgi:LCP family protein required for cell wall assembly